MCTLILKVLPRILTICLLLKLSFVHATSKVDLSGVLPYEASYLKQQKPSPQTLVSDVLIIGGKEAMLLQQALKSNLSGKWASEVRIGGLTSPELNLARLSSLFQYHAFSPKWIIYLPSLDDEDEEIFDYKDSDAIRYNLQRAQTWWWQLLYKVWPGLALSTVKKTHKMSLRPDPAVFLEKLSDTSKIQRSLASAALFQTLLEQLILTHEKTNFLLVSTPFDPNTNPQNCKTSLTWPTKSIFKDQMKSISDKNWEEALDINDSLKQVAPFYSSTYYLRAKILKQLHKNESSYRFLNLSWMMNCRSPYVALKNTLMQSFSLTYPGKVYFYDLAKFVSDECFLTDKNCFEGENLTANFYRTTAEVLKLLITQKLEIN